MAINWYQCKNCGTTIKQDKNPINSGCSVKTHHSWTKLAEVGDIKYNCKKCGTTIQTKNLPLNGGCPSTTSTHHSWTKL
jgi:rubrerythrin